MPEYMSLTDQARGAVGVTSGGRPDYGSGPHLLLIGAVVGLAVRDLDDPRRSDEARAFLHGQPYRGRPVGIDLEQFADCIGYEGDIGDRFAG